jgi:hypothetical protein
MDGLGFLFIAYWAAAGIIFLIGLIKLIIAASNGGPAKGGLRLLIISVIMVVIGVGACAMILSNISVR